MNERRRQSYYLQKKKTGELRKTKRPFGGRKKGNQEEREG